MSLNNAMAEKWAQVVGPQEQAKEANGEGLGAGKGEGGLKDLKRKRRESEPLVTAETDAAEAYTGPIRAFDLVVDRFVLAGRSLLVLYTASKPDSDSNCNTANDADSNGECIDSMNCLRERAKQAFFGRQTQDIATYVAASGGSGNVAGVEREAGKDGEGYTGLCPLTSEVSLELGKYFDSHIVFQAGGFVVCECGTLHLLYLCNAMEC
jgi:hypothetical protein